MRQDEFRTFVAQLLDYYMWSGDKVLRRALGNPMFVQAFLKRCEQDEEKYNIVFSDAVYYRIPKEIQQLKAR